MSLIGRGLGLWLTGISLLLLTACATRAPVAPAPDALIWSGRMALHIASTPPQSLNAGFELQSQRQGGQLLLFTPLGSTLAKLQWTPAQARLEQGSQVWLDDSLEALLLRLTGTALPMAALIDWLQERPTQIEGWRADLSQMSQGRLWVYSQSASATTALPQVNLRLILER